MDRNYVLQSSSTLAGKTSNPDGGFQNVASELSGLRAAVSAKSFILAWMVVGYFPPYFPASLALWSVTIHHLTWGRGFGAAHNINLPRISRTLRIMEVLLNNVPH